MMPHSKMQESNSVDDWAGMRSEIEGLKNLHNECKFFNKLIKIKSVLDWLIEMQQG